MMLLAATLATPAYAWFPPMQTREALEKRYEQIKQYDFSQLEPQERQKVNVYVTISPKITLDVQPLLEQTKKFYATEEVDLEFIIGEAPVLDRNNVSLSFVEPEEFLAYTGQPKYVDMGLPFMTLIGEPMQMPNPLVGFACVENRQAYIRVFPQLDYDVLLDTAQHELGHLFSLYHKDGTLMGRGSSTGPLTLQQRYQALDYLNGGAVYHATQIGFEAFVKFAEEAEALRKALQ